MDSFSCGKCGSKFESESALSMHVQAKHVDAEAVRRELEAEKRSKQLKKYAKYALALLAFIGISYAFFSYAASRPVIGSAGSTHIHMNWSVVINGVPVWLENPKYQLRSPLVHMEDGESEIHKHATGVTMGYFLDTLGWRFSKECLELDTKEKYCSGDDGKSLKFIVNGKPNDRFDRYDLQDGDEIQIIYG